MGIHNHRWEEFRNHSKEDSHNAGNRKAEQLQFHNHRWEEFRNHSKEDSRNSWEVSHTVGIHNHRWEEFRNHSKEDSRNRGRCPILWVFIITAGRSSVTIPRRIVVIRGRCPILWVS